MNPRNCDSVIFFNSKPLEHSVSPFMSLYNLPSSPELLYGCEDRCKQRKSCAGESMGEQEKSSRLIMVAVDESEESINALQWALNNLYIPPDRIILVHAQRSPISPFATGSPGFMVPLDVLKMLEIDMKKSVQKVLAKASEICRAKNVTPETEAHIGDARETICNAAKKYNPDILVLGSHEYGAFKRVLIGSVSDYCVHHVQCPVVVVKPKKDQAH